MSVIKKLILLPFSKYQQLLTAQKDGRPEVAPYLAPEIISDMSKEEGVNQEVAVLPIGVLE